MLLGDLEIMVRFGIEMPTIGVDYKTVRAISQEVERLGFSSAWLADHVMPPPWIPPNTPRLECWTTISALAPETKTLRLGTSVLSNTFRHPSILAKMAATLDSISNGRLEFGIGAGWNEAEHAAYGIPFPEPLIRIRRMEEAIKLIKMMWTEEKTTFKGRYYSLTEATLYPKPVQKPHPPIMVGGRGEKVMLKIVAEHADISNFDVRPSPPTPEEYRGKVEVLMHHCSALGRDSGQIEKSLLTDVVIAENQQEVREKTRRFRQKASAMAGREISFDDYCACRIVGTPEECISKISEYVEVGATYFICQFPDLADLKPLEVFSEKVMSAFR